MIVSMVIANYKVRKILVDTGSAIDILFYEIFLKIKLLVNKFVLVYSLLCGFTKEVVMLEGIIALLVLIGISLRQLSMMVDFLVVKVPSVYNTILDRTSLRMANLVMPIYHLMVKFLIE